ncbi:MAG: molecular chaperone TorD family protein [Gammaproteobacteria bacterium]|nr:molecular chaperone TorD family protein [Gammaproteobacteria bacterium]
MKDSYNDNCEKTLIMQAQPSTEPGYQQGAQKSRVQANQVQHGQPQHGQAQQAQDVQSAEKPLAEDQYRAGAYSLLAELLRQSPQQAILKTVTGLAEGLEKKDDLAIAMSMLGLSARDAKINHLDDEFHALFIGLGRGELVPYGSWYMTGFLMEKPLGILREDLARLGFVRNKNTFEPEDHVAALCEVMAQLISEGRDLDQQISFFDVHMSSWLAQFYADLSEAKSAVFYRSVARFGKAFFDFEKQYLAMSV